MLEPIQFRKFRWRKGEPIRWSRKPWTEDDLVGVIFVLAMVLAVLTGIAYSTFPHVPLP